MESMELRRFDMRLGVDELMKSLSLMRFKKLMELMEMKLQEEKVFFWLKSWWVLY
jgi:hypothetical protein